MLANFCVRLLEKISAFLDDHLLPEILTRSNEKSDACENVMSELDPPFGKMLRCANHDCDMEWFHYGCINIKRKPRGDWYCAACKE